MVTGLASTKIWRGRWGAVRTCSSRGSADVLNFRACSWASNCLALESCKEILKLDSYPGSITRLLTGTKKQYICASHCRIELSLSWCCGRLLASRALISAAICSRSSSASSSSKKRGLRRETLEATSNVSSSAMNSVPSSKTINVSTCR